MIGVLVDKTVARLLIILALFVVTGGIILMPTVTLFRVGSSGVLIQVWPCCLSIDPDLEIGQTPLATNDEK